MGLNEKFFTSLSEPIVPVANLKLHLDASDTNSYSGAGSTWYDLTANNEDGTISGATWNPAGYFSFDGSNDYVQISPIPSTAQNDNIITAEAWINPITATNNSIISFRGSTNTTIKLFLGANSSGQLYLVSSSTTGFLALGLTSVTAPVGQWTHVVGSIDYVTKDYYIYVNGSLASSGTDSNIRSANTFNSSNFFIGTNLVGVQYSNLNISKVRTYDIALTSTEITALHLEGP